MQQEMYPRLVDEPAVIVLPTLAKLIGLNQAIVLQELHFLLFSNEGTIEVDGHEWVRKTYEEWQAEQFTFWSCKTVQRVFTELEGLGLIVSRAFDKSSMSRRKYYRVNYDEVTRILDAWTEAEIR